jgi:hypothetical protein
MANLIVGFMWHVTTPLGRPECNGWVYSHFTPAGTWQKHAAVRCRVCNEVDHKATTLESLKASVMPNDERHEFWAEIA